MKYVIEGVDGALESLAIDRKTWGRFVSWGDEARVCILPLLLAMIDSGKVSDAEGDVSSCLIGWVKLVGRCRNDRVTYYAS